jgi:hypothetical protein
MFNAPKAAGAQAEPTRQTADEQAELKRGGEPRRRRRRNGELAHFLQKRKKGKLFWGESSDAYSPAQP